MTVDALLESARTKSAVDIPDGDHNAYNHDF
jgi:hypothetical protein